MDINLPGMNGIECTAMIKERYPEILIMMCTVFEDSEKIFNALKAGANGYILKRAAGETLLDAIKELLKGGAPMSSDIARKVVSSFRETPVVENHDASLTRRENEILELLGKGYGNKEIADKLFVSIHTVRTHIYHIYEKLHVRNRVEAVNKTGRK
jgi:DNA-binding NarL/FixJ family response regulator